MTAGPAFSLWLVGEGDGWAALQATVERLAAEHGGPTFPAHLTLLGSQARPEAEVVALAERLAGGIAPRILHLDDIDRDVTYYQSLFAVIRATPELLAARAAAERAFGHPEPVPYRPHISLLYGFPPDETKAAIIDGLRGTLPASVDGSVLVAHETGPTPADWREVFRGRLTGPG